MRYALCILPAAALTLFTTRVDASIVYAVQTGQVIRFDAASPNTTFAIVSTSALLSPFPQGIDFGPDGQLYVVQASSGDLYRINPSTGSLATVATLPRPVGTSGSFFQDLAFDPASGSMCTVLSNSSTNTHHLLQINMGTYATTDLGVITGIPATPTFIDSLAIGSDGTRYITSRITNQVYTLNGLAANPLGSVPASSSPINGLGIDRTAFPNPTGDVLYTGTDIGVQGVTPGGGAGAMVWNGGRVWDLTIAPVPAPSCAVALGMLGSFCARRTRQKA